MRWLQIYIGTIIFLLKTVVCMKQFQPRFIITEDRLKGNDGSEIVCQRRIPKPSDDAHASIFNNIYQRRLVSPFGRKHCSYFNLFYY